MLDKASVLAHWCRAWFDQRQHHQAMKAVVSAGLILAIVRPDQVHVAILANMIWLWLEP